MKRILFIALALTILGCSDDSHEKGFQVSEITEADGKKIVGLPIDSLNLETRPGGILLTKNPNHRLIPIYKMNRNNRTGESFTGSNNFHTRWDNGQNRGNNWNYNLMPGLEATYGYNMINVAHYSTEKAAQNEFFENPVLIKTLYYPAFSNDTLNYKPVRRVLLYDLSLR